jgi:hypothetical protein
MSDENDKKILEVMNATLKLLNKKKLNIPELLLFFGNLGYHIGASMAGLKANGPGIEELKREYYSNPTVDTGLMMQGLLINQWVDDYKKSPKLSNFAVSKPKKE